MNKNNKLKYSGLIKPDEGYDIVNHNSNHSSAFIKKGYKIIIQRDESKIYLFNNKIHRRNAPAKIENDIKYWVIHDKYHRIGGAALEFNDLPLMYYIRGKIYNKDEYYKELTKCIFCKFQDDNKQSLLVHYDYEEEWAV